MPDQPSISVITPSLNQGRFIRQTIESVRAQGGEDWEHIVVDGGSSDVTVAILESYPDLRWVSEPDRGQSDALNKAMKMSRGEIIFWINSDDVVAPGAFAAARTFFDNRPEAAIVCGNAVVIDEGGNELRRTGPRVRAMQLRRPWNGSTSMHQPSIVFRREVWRAVGGFDESLHYAMDYDFFLRASRAYGFHHLPVDFGLFRKSAGTKTGDTTEKSFPEVCACLIRFVRETGDGSARWTAARAHFAQANAWVNDAVECYESGNRSEARRLLRRAFLRHPLSLTSYPHLRYRVDRLIGRPAFDRLRALLRGSR
jgi:glycosyltransferase involved in cell wall biosynthesis